MNTNRILALAWRWLVALTILCALLWSVRGYVATIGAVIMKIVVGLSLLSLMTAIGFLLLSALCFVFFEPWGRWLIKWLTAKDKMITSQQHLLSAYEEDQQKYFKNLDKLNDATWTAWLTLKTLGEIGGWSQTTLNIKSLYALLVAKETLNNLRSMGVGNGILYRHVYDSKEAVEQLALFRRQLRGGDIRAIYLTDLGTDEVEIEGFEKEILQMAADEEKNPLLKHRKI